MQGFQNVLSGNRPLLPVLVKFLKYGLTGGFAAIIDIGGFILLMAIGLSAFPAATISYLVAVSTNYALTSHFIYATPPTLRGWLHFILFAALGLCLNVLITLTMLNYLEYPALVAKATGVGIAFVANFLMVNFIVFKEAK